jgi:NAD(P)-dependent dehydrogenase (short-subunit alcohol dehydrogenase family)
MGRLQGKIAFITGSGAGQGRAAAQLFAAEGASIVGCDLDPRQAAATVDLVRSAGGRMESFAPVDLCDPGATKGWIEAGLKAFGGIDVLYNNAAAVKFGSVTDTPIDEWRFTFEHEIDLLFYSVRAAWPHLLARGGGSIINTASISAYRSSAEIACTAHAAAKGAVVSFTRQIAAQGAKHRIRANSISPGAIDTQALAVLNEEQRAALARSFPLGRIGTPKDVAYCALYLASDESSWITAADFLVDGGMTNIIVR